MENQTKHNPDYKLISLRINNKEFVYGETNEGENQGLEVYFYKTSNDNHFYRSYRYVEQSNENERLLPKIYKDIYLKLKNQIGKVLPGHKLDLNQTV